MRAFQIYLLLLLFFSCGTPKSKKNIEVLTHPPGISTELYFHNCDSLRTFLRTVVVNNDTDSSLPPGQFRLRYINPTYEAAGWLFHSDCFIGLTEEELISLLGRWTEVETSESYLADYYVNYNPSVTFYDTFYTYRRLAITALLKDSLVWKFSVVPGTDKTPVVPRRKRD